MDEAKQYATERQIEQERARLRVVNKARKDRGEKPLPLPPRHKAERPARTREHDTNSEDGNSDEDGSERQILQYEGRE